jgi:hypothetical protein
MSANPFDCRLLCLYASDIIMKIVTQKPTESVLNGKLTACKDTSSALWGPHFFSEIAMIARTAFIAIIVQTCVRHNRLVVR